MGLKAGDHHRRREIGMPTHFVSIFSSSLAGHPTCPEPATSTDTFERRAWQRFRGEEQSSFDQCLGLSQFDQPATQRLSMLQSLSPKDFCAQPQMVFTQPRRIRYERMKLRCIKGHVLF